LELELGGFGKSNSNSNRARLQWRLRLRGIDYSEGDVKLTDEFVKGVGGGLMETAEGN
jgi:succinate dehydrogenase flavin-adding protein (antitoxin of CptAB toxin-antitoxin module)